MAGAESAPTRRKDRTGADPAALAQVVGVILGSPEYQRK